MNTRQSHFLPEHRPITQVPAHVRGRYRRDPLLVVANKFSTLWFGTFPRLKRTTEVADINRTRTLRVARRDTVAHDENVVALTLTSAYGVELDPWTPGAHLDLLLPSGRIRQYSLCGDPANRDSYRIAVRRVPNGGGGSIEVHDTLAVGSLVRVTGPRNGLPMSIPGYGSPARRLRFVAGGIGITPILPMVVAAERLGLEWSMVYTGRSRDSLPFIDDVAAFGDKVTIRTDNEHGLPTTVDLLGDLPASTSVYCCGPTPMLELLRSALTGREDVELHYEGFSAPPVVDGDRFTVVLARSGRSIAVSAQESALAAVLREDPAATAYSCMQGFCGTCKVTVLAGEVDHRDSLLTAAERDEGAILTCVSRAADRTGHGKLVLDL
ncbi:PDR/VanB family oxidoreductase [Mycolicibacterium houstonense]|uniref:PDR/VanB family oxidoreductase n=1 Tax=Mycolicibacterium houstonense TaxID=146021 RepID=UPI000836BC10|nr:PDR/VanB family oxidoreductase [Mycolicibacterium houstonense]